MPIILCCLLIFIVWLTYQKKKNEKIAKQKSESFWSRERESNLTRRKDISQLHYITIDFKKLPFFDTDNKEIEYIQNQIKKLKDCKILNLSGISNTDLKLTYGTANLNELSTCDQNFTLLIRSLNTWGQLLYDNNQKEACECVLRYAIECGSDISNTFILLATLYQQQGCTNRIHELMEHAKTLTTPMKASIINKLSAICGEEDHSLESSDQ